jgi:uncharacterized membrane protein YedE/YeeE
MKYPDSHEIQPKKPISELLYRSISLFLVFSAIIAAIIATYLGLPPAGYIEDKLNINKNDGAFIIWFVFFFIFAMFAGIILRLIKPYSEVPKHPYGDLNMKSFFKGDADQDEYKINDKN